jgi:hypothetical protein
MKTKFLILFLTFLGFYISCTKTNIDESYQNRILGKWQLIEWYGSIGGPGYWQTIEDGYFYIFNEDGTIESDLYNCIGNYSIEENTEYNLFISFLCDSSQYEGNLKLGFAQNYLLLFGACDEGCGGKFKRIQNE